MPFNRAQIDLTQSAFEDNMMKRAHAFKRIECHFIHQSQGYGWKILPHFMVKKTFTMRQADKHDYSACSMYKRYLSQDYRLMQSTKDHRHCGGYAIFHSISDLWYRKSSQPI